MKRYFRAPGRINIIGEHTDYNDGYVLPAAIDRYVTLSIERTGRERIELSSAGREAITFREGEIEPAGNWGDYVKGIFHVLKSEKKVEFGGLSIEIESTVPEGAGLSSSAALEVATITALNEVFGLSLTDEERYRLSQRAENEFVGVKCGIMDQFASVMGRKDSAIFLDTVSMEYEYLPLELGAYSLVVFDSKVHHELLSGGYNSRREEARKALEILGKKSYRDVSMVDLFSARPKMEDLYYRRAMHVVSENMRVLEVVKILANSNYENLGRFLVQSHESLAYDYEVSCEEIDFIVDTLRNLNGVSGARMIGGGFGGSVLALCEKSEREKIVEFVRERYFEEFNIAMDAYEVRPSRGAGEIRE